jgi:hypothetical protein
MSNYSKTTDFAAKDALSTGNANKIVKGTEIDDEFSAIQTAVNTKADLSSPTLTGVPVSPTASAATNSTQIGTTAYVTTAIATAIAAVKEALHPVGSIYSQAAVSTNPGTLLGFGTWVAFGAGRVMVGIDSGNTLMDAVEETGGSADSPSVGANTGATSLTVAQMPAHNHSNGSSTMLLTDGNEAGTVSKGFSGGLLRRAIASAGSGDSHTHTQTSGTTTNTNYQPFITVYMWKRTV